MPSQYAPVTPEGIADLHALLIFLNQELLRISEAFGGVQSVILPKLNVAPAKVKDGMIVFADGVNWNPGAGRGVYRWDGVSNAWVSLG